MTYNLTAIGENTTGLVTFAQGINNVLMDGWLGVLLMLVIAFVTYGSFLFNSGDAKKAMAAMAFIVWSSALFLRALGLINTLALFLSLVGSAIAVALTWKENR